MQDRARLGSLIGAHVLVLLAFHGSGLPDVAGAGTDGVLSTVLQAPPLDAVAAVLWIVGCALTWWSLATTALAVLVHGVAGTTTRVRDWSLALVPGPVRHHLRRAMVGAAVSGVLLGSTTASASPLPPGLDPSTVLPAATATDGAADTLLPPGLSLATTLPTPHDSWQSDLPLATPDATTAAPVDAAPTPAPVAPNARHDTHVVLAGEHLWSIARDHLATVVASPGDEQLADHWRALVAMNLDELPSGDPDLVHPGQVLRLPEVSA